MSSADHERAPSLKDLTAPLTRRYCDHSGLYQEEGYSRSRAADMLAGNLTAAELSCTPCHHANIGGIPCRSVSSKDHLEGAETSQLVLWQPFSSAATLGCELPR